jgi:hypothetical protein
MLRRHPKRLAPGKKYSEAEAMRNDSLQMQAVGSEEHSSIGLVGRFNWKLIDSEIVGCQYRATR